MPALRNGLACVVVLPALALNAGGQTMQLGKHVPLGELTGISSHFTT